MWYFQSNYDAGVPPASFCVDGSQGPPCDPKLISIVRQPSPSHLTRSVCRAGGFVQVRLSETGSLPYLEAVQASFFDDFVHGLLNGWQALRSFELSGGPQLAVFERWERFSSSARIIANPTLVFRIEFHFRKDFHLPAGKQALFHVEQS